jgi:hypothetical protein
MYQRFRVTSNGMVLKMVNQWINYQFYINAKNERDCHNWPCKSTQEPCKNTVRVWIVSLVHTLVFPTQLRHSLIQMGKFHFYGVSILCSIGKDKRAFINETTARLRCVRVFVKWCSVTVGCDILFAPYKPSSRQSNFGHKSTVAGLFFEKSTVVGWKSWKSTVRSTFETIVGNMVNFLEKSQLLQDLGSAT